MNNPWLEMFNPWLKKNPFMSIWLSTANRMAGSMRGHALAEGRRQVNSAVTEATNENIRLLSEAVKAPKLRAPAPNPRKPSPKVKAPGVKKKKKKAAGKRRSS